MRNTDSTQFRSREESGEISKLREAVQAAREFMDYLRANTGFNDEWPIELKVAPDVAEHVNALLNRFEKTVYAVEPKPNSTRNDDSTDAD